METQVKKVEAAPVKVETTSAKTRKTADKAVLRKYIRDMVDYKYKTLTAYAEKEQVSLQYVSNVLSGHKPIPDWMLKRFSITHVVQEHWEVAA